MAFVLSAVLSGAAPAGAVGSPGSYADPYDDGSVNPVDISTVSASTSGTNTVLRVALAKSLPAIWRLTWHIEADRDLSIDDNYSVVAMRGQDGALVGSLRHQGRIETKPVGVTQSTSEVVVTFPTVWLGGSERFWFSVDSEAWSSSYGNYARSDSVAAGKPVLRHSGADAIDVALRFSRVTWSTYPHHADRRPGSMVLVGTAGLADGLVATALVGNLNAGLLFTASDALDQRVEAELKRVFGGTSGRVTLYGGTRALSSGIELRLRSLGYRVERVAGRDRYETARAAWPADGNLGGGPPAAIFLADGERMADSLTAGPAVLEVRNSVLLLTAGATLPPATRAFIDAHPSVPRWAIGGAAAAADRAARPLAGIDRYDTARLVAQQFFNAPQRIQFANGTSLAEALLAAGNGGRLHSPLLLLTNDAIPDATSAYLAGHKSLVQSGDLFAGVTSVNRTTQLAAEPLIN